MRIDMDLVWIAAGVVAALLLIALIAGAVRRRRSEKLRAEFGPEYEHAVRTSKSRSRAEAELAARRERARTQEVRALASADRDHFTREWHRIESRFLDRPTTAVVEAEELISEVLTRRGFPPGDLETRIRDLSAHQPHLAGEMRAVHEVVERRPSGEGATEEMRQALVRMRRVFEEVLGEPIRPESALGSGRAERPTPPADPSRIDPVIPVVHDDDRRPR